MKFGIRSRQDLLLFAVALLFVAILVGFFVWGVRALVTNLNAAIRFESAPAQDAGFELEAARAVLLRRGLIE